MDIDNTLRSADTTAGNEIARLRARVEEVVSERVAPAVDTVVNQAADAAQAATDTVRDQLSRLTHAVQERPLTALSLAGVAGLMVALLVRR